MERGMARHRGRAVAAIAAAFAAASIVAAGSHAGSAGAALPFPAASAADAQSLLSERGPRPAYVPGEVLVRFRGQPRNVIHEIPRRRNPVRAAERLSRRPDVVYAAPNYIAYAAGRMIPNDPGTSGFPRGWASDQWNFLAGPGGIALPPAWSALRRSGIPGGGGTRSRARKKAPIVAVLDTGIAFTNEGDLGRSPDFRSNQFVPGRDFIAPGTPPYDENGHGTHIAGTIGEQVNNGTAVTGIAYGVRLMPVRVLDDSGAGTTRNIAAAIRWAVANGADVINLSLEFEGLVASCDDIPAVCAAIDRARARRVMVVGAAGNGGLDNIGDGEVSLPARAGFAVGAVTVRGCRALYSNFGDDLDIMAPGGGEDAVLTDERCEPLAADNPGILQLSFEAGSGRGFELVELAGTSMAAAHVTAVAALVIATRQLVGRAKRPPVLALERQLRETARAMGDAANYGAGVVSASGAIGAGR